MINFKKWVESFDPEHKWDWKNPEECKIAIQNAIRLGHADFDLKTIFEAFTYAQESPTGKIKTDDIWAEWADLV